MQMDCNLNKLANFFKFLMCILEKSLKTDFSFLLPKISLHSGVLNVLDLILHQAVFGENHILGKVSSTLSVYRIPPKKPR